MKRLLAILLALTVSPLQAAINPAMNWYVRAGGAETNGGGYDSTIAGAGTNYADQDAPQLSITDLTSTNSTTVTSVLSTFTSAMVGNVLRIASGTGATTGYYTITTYVSASTITLDRVSGTYTAGVAKVGGAHATMVNYSNGGAGLPTPALTTPLIAGNTVNIRGGGTDDPSVSDYDYSAGYWQFPNGDATTGAIKFVGYNGRPMFSTQGLMFHALSYFQIKHIKVKITANGFPSYGSLFGGVSVQDSIFDANGFDASGIGVGGGNAPCLVLNNEFRNSGGGAVGIYRAINETGYSVKIIGNYIHDQRGDGILVASADEIFNNIIVNNGRHGVYVSGTYAGTTVINNTISGNGGSGYYTDVKEGISNVTILNNIITGNAYGIRPNLNSTAVNDRILANAWDYNDVWNNSTANYSNISAGTHDLSLDPQFTNSAGGDYSIGTNLKAKGFPGLFPGSSSTGYLDIGAAQRQEAGAGGTKGAPYLQ